MGGVVVIILLVQMHTLLGNRFLGVISVVIPTGRLFVKPAETDITGSPAKFGTDIKSTMCITIGSSLLVAPNPNAAEVVTDPGINP